MKGIQYDIIQGRSAEIISAPAKPDDKLIIGSKTIPTQELQKELISSTPMAWSDAAGQHLVHVAFGSEASGILGLSYAIYKNQQEEISSLRQQVIAARGDFNKMLDERGALITNVDAMSSWSWLKLAFTSIFRKASLGDLR